MPYKTNLVHTDSSQRCLVRIELTCRLARHGVRVAVKADCAEDIDVGNALLSRAADLSADLSVRGAYGHSRLKEMVLGSATRTILATMSVPLLMAH